MHLFSECTLHTYGRYDCSPDFGGVDMFWVGLIVGFFIGGTVRLFAMALMVAASRDERTGENNE